MEYSALVEAYEKLSSTTKRLEKTAIIAELLKKTKDDLWEDELNNLVANFFLSRKQGNTATGQVTFYVSYQPQATFVIPGGTIVSKPATAGNPPVKFITTTSSVCFL